MSLSCDLDIMTSTVGHFSCPVKRVCQQWLIHSFSKYRVHNTCRPTGIVKERPGSERCANSQSGGLSRLSPGGISVVSGGGRVRGEDLNLSAILMYIVSMISNRPI